MVSTRSTKRRSHSPPPVSEKPRAPKTPRKSKGEPAEDALKQSLESVKVILLDIEGTICSISFVKETLFPYALKALPEVLKSKWDDPEFIPYRDAFPESARESPESFEAHAKDLTDRDVKIAYLKNLQGFLWEEGYKSHAYSTPIYDDVLTAFDSKWWSSKKVAIYSSGSVFAQKLLFQHIKTSASSEDLSSIQDRRDMVKGWFDTTNAGLKQEASSYTKIAKELGTEPAEILFLSDNVKEVRAAIEAGMKSIVVDRPGNAALSDEDKKEFTVISSFEQVTPK